MDSLATANTSRKVATQAIVDLQYAIRQLELVTGSQGLGTYDITDCMFRALAAVNRVSENINELKP